MMASLLYAIFALIIINLHESSQSELCHSKNGRLFGNVKILAKQKIGNFSEKLFVKKQEKYEFMCYATHNANYTMMGAMTVRKRPLIQVSHGNKFEEILGVFLSH